MKLRMYRCPVCNRLHGFNPLSQDINDLQCSDNETSEIRNIKGHENTELLTMNEWNFNKADTKKSSYTNNLKLVGVQMNYPHPRRLRNW